jgi:hypothetical protein
MEFWLTREVKDKKLQCTRDNFVDYIFLLLYICKNSESTVTVQHIRIFSTEKELYVGTSVNLGKLPLNILQQRNTVV